jgi:hypothetical protein
LFVDIRLVCMIGLRGEHVDGNTEDASDGIVNVCPGRKVCIVSWGDDQCSGRSAASQTEYSVCAVGCVLR